MKFHIFILILVFVVSSCDGLFLGEEGDVLTVEDNMRPPEYLEDGLEVSTLEAEGLDEARIRDVVNYMQEEERFIFRGLLIARNNKLVHESYYHGWNRDRKQDMRSATKSMTSAIMGIAIDQGYISGVEERILDYFDEYESYDNWHEYKTEMTIQDFLQMRTGLMCNDHSENSPGHQKNMYPTDDWVKFILDLPVSGEGTTESRFSYCTGSPVTLGVIIAKATGKSFPEFAHENLWSHLGVTDYNWEYMPNGMASAGGQVHMKPRDALKFGLLFLNEGVWEGKRLISSEWIEESTTNYRVAGSYELGYGYLWWLNTWIVNEVEIPAYFARGNGGQMIVVVPDRELVIVMTGGLYEQNWTPSRLNLVSRVLAALN